MAVTPLSDEEINRLRVFLQYIPTVQEEAEYRAAQRLVLRTWKRTVIALAAVVGASILLWEKIGAILRAATNGG